MKKVLILAGSPRVNGNSEILADEFARGAEENGNRVEKIRVADKNIGYCKACYKCVKLGKCIIEDDMAEIMEKIIAADVIVLASPVYFYSVSAQLKTLIDRTMCRWEEVQNKEFYYIATAAEEGDDVATRTIECFRGFADCVEGAKEMGIVLGLGAEKRGDVKKTDAVVKAYEMGKTV